jgi:uncharacterized protein YpiB (UPF0302 family)
MCISDKSRITRDVLSYLIAHQDAQDTLEGIVEWWLVEQRIKQQTAKVKEVLDYLVEGKYLLESTGMDSRIRYRINHSKRNEIFSLIEESTA